MNIEKYYLSSKDQTQKIELTIEMLENNEVPEVNHIITTEESKTLDEYFSELDSCNYFNDYEGKTISEAVCIYSDLPKESNEFYLETLQHMITCLFGNKYEGVY